MAGKIGPRTPQRLALLRATGAGALALVFFIPGPLVILFATFVFWATFALGQPLQQRLWSMMYPSDRRGKLLGIVGTGRFAAGTLALLAVTLLIDSSAGRFVIMAVAIVATISAFAIGGVKLPPTEPQRSFGIAEALRILREQPVLRRVTLAQILYGAGIVSAGPLIAMVYVDRLGLGMSDIALAGLTVYAATALAFGPAGRFANRIGGLRAIALGSLLSGASLVIFAVAPSLVGVLIAAVVLGISSAAVNVSWPLILAEHASLEQQASVAAGMATIMGARGLVAPFLLMLPISAGLLGVTEGLIICVALSSAGALIYAQAAGVQFSLGKDRRAPYMRTLVTAVGLVGTLMRF
jgi:predicted MFS family arabinose efflux permease